MGAMCGYGAAAFMPALTMGRPIFYRERADGYYSATAYFVAKFLLEAFVAAFTSLFFTVIVFHTLSLQGSYGVFLLGHYLLTMIGVVLAYCVAGLVPDLGAANALLPTYVTVCMYLGGLFILFDSIGDWCAWFGYTTFMIKQFEDQANGAVAVYDGKTVLDFYGMDSSRNFVGDMWLNIMMLMIIMTCWGIFGTLTINFVNHTAR